MHEFCDGCSCQYKIRHCLGHLPHSLNDLGYKKMIRNFFETSHAKGPQDAAGGLVKNQTDLAVLRGKTMIQNASDLYNFANAKLTTPKSSSCKRRIFKYTKTINRSVPMLYKPIRGVRSIHQAVVENVLLRTLSCYSCHECLSGNIMGCKNTAFVGDVSSVFVERENEGIDENDDDVEEPDVPLCELITKHTIFAVLCDDDDKCDYFLLRAQTESFELENLETDSWGVSYDRGTNVIKGNFFSQGPNPLNFKLIKRKFALVPSYSCLVICVDATLTNRMLTLTEDTHQSILKCVEMSLYTQ